MLVSKEIIASSKRKIIPASFCRLVRVNEKIHPAYAYYWLQEMYMSGRAGNYELRSTGISNFQFEHFLDAEFVRLPNLDEQIIIGQSLKEIDDRITLLRQTNTTLESIAQALFKSWFIDFDPVRAKMEGRQPEGMDAETAALFPEELVQSELGEIPKDWKYDRLGSYLNVLESGRRPKGGVGAIREGIPSVGAESITRIGEFDYSKTKYIPHDFFGKIKSGIIESHDVLLYKDGGKPGEFLPRISMFGLGFPFSKFAVNEHVFRLRTIDPMGQAFLYFWMWSDLVVNDLMVRGGKAAIPGVNQNDVRSLYVLVADGRVHSAFERMVMPLMEKILTNAVMIKNLADTRDTLLPKLMSGQLRIQDVEDQV